MNGLKFINFNDPRNSWSLRKVVEITNLIKAYVDEKNLTDVELLLVEDNTWSDEDNQRYDIEIQYTENGRLIWQKLLIMKGEVIDGATFHERHEEYYPANKKGCKENQTS